jgi:ribokinase
VNTGGRTLIAALAGRLPLSLSSAASNYDILVDAPDRPGKGETVTGCSWAPKFGGNQAAARGPGVATAMVGAVGDDRSALHFSPGLIRQRWIVRLLRSWTMQSQV